MEITTHKFSLWLSADHRVYNAQIQVCHCNTQYNKYVTMVKAWYFGDIIGNRKLHNNIDHSHSLSRPALRALRWLVDTVTHYPVMHCAHYGDCAISTEIAQSP